MSMPPSCKSIYVSTGIEKSIWKQKFIFPQIAKGVLHMSKYQLQVGMVLFYKGWFWKVERKLNESWRLRSLRNDNTKLLTCSDFFKLYFEGNIFAMPNFTHKDIESMSTSELISMARRMYKHQQHNTSSSVAAPFNIFP